MRENYSLKLTYGVMKAKGIDAGETKIGKVFDEINPDADKESQEIVSNSFNPKIYNAIYFGHKIYYGQNEKIGMFGIVHVCALDRFSGKIVEHATMV